MDSNEAYREAKNKVYNRFRFRITQLENDRVVQLDRKKNDNELQLQLEIHLNAV